MTNFGAKILNNSTSALSAQQAVIAATSSNIGNVNTEGYVRRSVELQTRVSSGNSAGLNIGNGVEVTALRRAADEFLEKALRAAKGEEAGLQVQDDYLSRVEELFSLTGTVSTVGTELTNFFTAINDLASNPASIELRANVIEKIRSLTDSIRNSYTTVANLQQETERRLNDEVQTVNTLTSQIAELNSLVSGREAGEQTAADERDKRDLLLKQLSERISFTTLELPGGSVNISLPTGFNLVNGATARAIELDSSPSFRTGSGVTGLDGSVLNWVVYDFDPGAGEAQIDLTQTLMQGTGTIGGLLAIRGYADPAAANTTPFATTGPLAQVGSRLEALARTLLTTVNQRYVGPDEDTVTAGHQPSAGDLDGNAALPYGLFGIPTATPDANADGLANDLAALGFVSYASIIRQGVTDPRDIAAARDSDPTVGTLSFQAGDNRNLIDAASADLSDLQNESRTFALGSYSLTGTFTDFYDELVTHVGNARSRAEVNLSVSRNNVISAENRRDAISAVSLDEEFSNLIRFQRAFEAAARMIKVADEIMQQIVGLI